MDRKRGRAALAVALVALIALATSSCGGDDASGGAGDAAKEPTADASDDAIPEVATQVIVKGDGAQPVKGDIVLVHFVLTLPDGKKIESTRDRNEPYAFTLGVGHAPPGFDDAVLKMPVGARVQLTVPWRRAYGERGYPGVLPPRTDLLFDLELLGIVVIRHEVIQAGTGPAVRTGQTVLVHYTGTLPDGTKFDSSDDRDEPLPVQVGAGNVIPGWDLTLAKMRVGDRWKVTIPAPLAYGNKGTGTVPPNSDLTFDTEVLGFLEPTIEILKRGEGPQPRTGQMVSVHYVGTLEDGTKFDSSRDRGEPYEFQLGAGQVIQGWEMVVSSMRVGDHWNVKIPWQLAYGKEGSPSIPPKTNLVFDMELMAIK